MSRTPGRPASATSSTAESGRPRGCPQELVYAGFSLGVLPTQALAPEPSRRPRRPAAQRGRARLRVRLAVAGQACPSGVRAAWPRPLVRRRGRSRRRARARGRSHRPRAFPLSPATRTCSRTGSWRTTTRPPPVFSCNGSWPSSPLVPSPCPALPAVGSGHDGRDHRLPRRAARAAAHHPDGDARDDLADPVARRGGPGLRHAVRGGSTAPPSRGSPAPPGTARSSRTQAPRSTPSARRWRTTTWRRAPCASRRAPLPTSLVRTVICDRLAEVTATPDAKGFRRELYDDGGLEEQRAGRRTARCTGRGGGGARTARCWQRLLRPRPQVGEWTTYDRDSAPSRSAAGR